MVLGLGECEAPGGVGEKAGLKPETREGGGRGGRDELLEPGGGGYDMMNFAVRPNGCVSGSTRTSESQV